MAETPEGFLLCLGVSIARTGVMEYGPQETPLEVGDDGIVYIDRAEAEVFRPETIASFEGKPVTITHPTEFVTKDNWSYLAKGIIQNVRRGSGEFKDDLIADVLVTDSIAINLVKSGLREVSCGYEAEYTQTGKGKGVQTHIIGNHLALVDEGRAGSDYAIKDHKGVRDVDKKTLLEQIKSIFAKGQDEAMKKVADAFPDKKDDDKKESKDEDPKKEEKSKDSPGMGYDELVKAVKDLNATVASMATPTTAAKDEEEESEDEDKEEPAKDETQVTEAGMEDRLKKLEAAVAKLLEGVATDADESDESEDAEEGEVVGDEDKEESEDGPAVAKLTGDEVSRIEILAPGMDASIKDAKSKALKKFNETTIGKTLLSSLAGGKKLTFDSAQVETLFISASELMKSARNSDLTKTRQVRDAELIDGTAPERVMTAEKMNEMNAKFYKKESK